MTHQPLVISRRSIQLCAKLAGRARRSSLLRHRGSDFEVIAVHLHLAPILAGLGRQPGYHLVGLLPISRVDDAHSPLVHHLLRRRPIEDDRHPVRRVAIALCQLRHQRIARSRELLQLQHMQRRVALDHIIAINQYLTAHVHTAPRLGKNNNASTLQDR
jgi:hypothetical protein